MELNVILIHRLWNSCETTFVSWFTVKHICMCLCNLFCVYYLGWCGKKLKHWRLFACTWSWWWKTSLLWEGPYGLQELEGDNHNFVALTFVNLITKNYLLPLKFNCKKASIYTEAQTYDHWNTIISRTPYGPSGHLVIAAWMVGPNVQTLFTGPDS